MAAVAAVAGGAGTCGVPPSEAACAMMLSPLAESARLFYLATSLASALFLSHAARHTCTTAGACSRRGGRGRGVAGWLAACIKRIACQSHAAGREASPLEFYKGAKVVLLYCLGLMRTLPVVCHRELPTSQHMLILRPPPAQLQRAFNVCAKPLQVHASAV